MIFFLAMCAYLFINHYYTSLHLFHDFTFLYCSYIDLCFPIGDTPLRYLHMVRGVVNFILVGAQCYLKVTPHHNHC
jgi:hypothetical protein